MVFKKIIFQNRYVALETPSRPPPFMANAILNFHFDYPHPSLRLYLLNIQAILDVFLTVFVFMCVHVNRVEIKRLLKKK